MESSFMIIKPNAIGEAEEIVDFITSLGLNIVEYKMSISTREKWNEHYSHRKNRSKQYIVNTLSGKHIICLHIRGKNAVKVLNDNKKSMRKKWGRDRINNGIHISDIEELAIREMGIWEFN